ncbi:MAG: TIM-barrel domain-containing protein [Breznakibacter sp.]
MKKSLVVLLVSILLIQCICAQQPNPILAGKARFTVITPELIRMEYAVNGVFVDDPTLFAYERNNRSSDFEFIKENDRFIIRTSRMELTYKNDGLPFSQMNIRIQVFRPGQKDYDWRIYSENEHNLGGTLATLDGIGGEVPLEPGLLSRDGWYMIDDSGKEILKNGWLVERPVKHLRDLYFFAYGTDYKAALRALTAIGGVVPMTRKYVHGSWYCRWWNYTEQEYRDIIQGYKDHNFPIDILVMDMGWHRQDFKAGMGHAGNYGWTGYSWNRKLLPNAEKLISELKKDQIYLTLNDHPLDGIRYGEDSFSDFMKAMGADTSQHENLFFDAGNKKYMTNFFKFAHEPLEKQGIDFWWLDWQQDYVMPYVPGFRNVKHLPWLNHLYYDHSLQNGKRGLCFSRWAGWGSHRTPIQFSGDADGNWDMLRFEVKFTASSSNVGCFFWAHDIGGFYGERNPEMYVRWTQFGLTNSSLRIHSVYDKELDRRPWLWGKAEENAMRKIYHLRSQLMPYIYSSVWQCHTQTLPLIRSMYIEYPTIEEAYNNSQQYLFGDLFMAAPITSTGVGDLKTATQEVWIPENEAWYNFFTGTKMQSGKQTVSATLDETPLFVRGGIPIPMQPYKTRMASAPLDTIILRCFPGEEGKEGSYQLYEDDGVTQEYEKGNYAITHLSYFKKDGQVSIGINAVQGAYQDQPTKRAYRIELPGEKFSSAKINGRKTRINGNTLFISATNIKKNTIVELF